MDLPDGTHIRRIPTGDRPDVTARADLLQAEQHLLDKLGALHLRRTVAGVRIRDRGTAGATIQMHAPPVSDLPADLRAAVNRLEEAEREVGIRHVRYHRPPYPHNRDSAESGRGRGTP